jgi:hypothetical protein
MAGGLHPSLQLLTLPHSPSASIVNVLTLPGDFCCVNLPPKIASVYRQTQALPGADKSVALNIALCISHISYFPRKLRKSLSYTCHYTR